ncbi:mobile element protein [Carboxydocella sp. ULO1]|nr:mobile element protein [Carboxydocella sp. ULO1]
MKWLPYLKLMAKRPTALKYSGFFKELPQTIQDYFERCEYQQKKAALQVLSKMVALTDIHTATKAFETTIKHGLTDLDSIWATFYTMTNQSPAASEIKLGDKIPDITPYSVDNSSYDCPLKGGDAGWKN